MRTRVRLAALVSALAVTVLTLAGCTTSPAQQISAADTITVTSLDTTLKEPGDADSGYNAAEVQVQVPVNPQRVVVLDSTILEAMNALGVPASQVAGVPKWGLQQVAPRYAGGDVASIDTADERGYDLEKIAALKPDLLITGWRGTAALIEGLADIDVPKIELTPVEGHTVKSLADTTEVLGAIFEKTAEATQLVDKLKTAVAAAKTATSSAGTGAVLMTTGGAISGVPVGDSRYGMLYNAFGIRVNPALEKVIVDLDNNSSGDGTHGWELSSEAILAANPDWLFVIDRDAAIGKAEKVAPQILDNELIKRSTAGSKGQIVYLDPVALYAGEGIVSYTAAAEQITREIAAKK